jgi:hypothetical protein
MAASPNAHRVAGCTGSQPETSRGATASRTGCALYGWMIRLLPARRLKGAAQLAGTLLYSRA